MYAQNFDWDWCDDGVIVGIQAGFHKNFDNIEGYDRTYSVRLAEPDISVYPFNTDTTTLYSVYPMYGVSPNSISTYQGNCLTKNSHICAWKSTYYSSLKSRKHEFKCVSFEYSSESSCYWSSYQNTFGEYQFASASDRW